MTKLNTADTPVARNYAIATNPALRLPFELLTYCLSREHGLDLEDVIRASHVSRHWRFLLLADPALWSKLHATKQPGLPLAFNREIFARSGAVPLNVTMVVNLGYMPWDPDDFALVKAGVSHFWHRMKCLELFFTGEHDGRDGWLYQARFNFLETSAPTLKLLKIIDRTYADTGFGGFPADNDLYWRVADDLLGGGGALEELDVEGTMLQLPERCPALSTMTSFHGRLHAKSSIPEHLPLICPRLRCLRLSNFFDVLQPFSAGDFRGLKELRLDFHGPPKEWDLAFRSHRVTLHRSIATIVVTATCWMPGNIEFLTQNQTTQRIEMHNLPVFVEQTEVDSVLPGYALYQNWDKTQALMVTNVGVPKRLSMQTILARGPAYHDIQELSLDFDLLLPFMETSPIMTALADMTVFVPAGQHDVEWRDGRFIVGPRRLLVILGLDYYNRAKPSQLPFTSAPSDAWRAHFDWRYISRKLPALRKVHILTKHYHHRENEGNRRHTYVRAAEVRALVELGLGIHSCESRTLIMLAITGIHFVDSEANTLSSLAELAQELVIDQAEYEVANPLPTAVLAHTTSI